ncbi:MAG: TVP38/TMEM64 family protein [Clostridia bacterium]|nr:TVP38/TMEM64 family protein [Clostridia bacterium]
MEERTNSKKKKNNRMLFLTLFFSFSVACAILAILCLNGVAIPLIRRNFTLFSALCGVVICGMYALAVWFTLAEKHTASKVLLSGYVLILFCLVLLLILQKTGFFEVVKDAEHLQAYLEKSGVWMPILYITLQFLQVVVLPIPSVVSTLAGVALFGALRATIYSLIGIVLGSYTAFFIGRKLGHKAVSWMIGDDTLKKWQKKLKGKDNLFLTLMFLFPMFPDDVLCFLAGLSSMTTKYFLIMIVVCRVIGVAGTCYSVDFIPFTTWWGIAIWVAFFLFVIVAFVLIYKNLDKIQEKFKARKQARKNK